MAARFECATLPWATMEGLTTEELWNRWADLQQWEWLPPHQDMRHRCIDEILYLGTYSAHKYQVVNHANVELKPAWCLWLGDNFFYCLWKELLFRWYMILSGVPALLVSGVPAENKPRC